VRAVLQRVKRAKVTVDDGVTGEIGPGTLVLLGVSTDDTEKDAIWLAEKIVNLRVFDDADGKMNLSLVDTGGALLVVSQFTLYGDASRGRRPSYIAAARPEKANELYEFLVEECRKLVAKVETGKFQAMMDVELVNDGPVTLLLETPKSTL
jgi:D-tyrosyl-tRNA(Tyr) deacylase